MRCGLEHDHPRRRSFGESDLIMLKLDVETADTFGKTIRSTLVCTLFIASL